MTFRFIGIDHVQLAAPPGCEEEARRFYGSILGWPELRKPESLQARGGVWFQCGSSQVHVGVQKEFRPAEKAHPGFAVDDLASLRSNLIASGVQALDDELREEEGIRRLFAKDPFGNRLEFLEYVSKPWHSKEDESR
ncbi:VOC family protein [Paenibacillus sp. LHD-117]|uniref:VOC family protein n=1 Tax=Paenibacillus sp. LHD-117 TaxID=3071412 RepID=UPI0027DF37AD|nr:VOC family protein [Paenibacillus sp. LHD-117]MDQ6418585.1 VOC family protein [Paenibacillus sp. LHD-117]